MGRFAATFLAILVGAFAAELTPPVQRVVVEPWTAAVAHAAGATMRWLDPGVTVAGATIMNRATGFAIQVLAGCNGIEAAIVLVAAMLAFPAPWKRRLAGIAIGIVAIQALNMVRIASLYYLGEWSPAAFEWAHLYAWQALIMLDALVVFLLWMRSLPRPGAEAPA